MSASVASSAVGLLDRRRPSPALGAEPDQPQWPNVMDVDRSNDLDMMRNGHKNETPNMKYESPSRDAQTDQDTRDSTIGGLLAALSCNSLPAKPRAHRSLTPPEDSPISQTSEHELVDGSSKEQDATMDEEKTRLISMELNDLAFAPPMSQDGGIELLALEQASTIPFPQYDLAAQSPNMNISTDPFPLIPDQDALPANVKRQIDAYARLEFADGTFYLNTFQCELGRDQHLYRDALKRDKEAKEAAELEKTQAKSSSGKASQRSHVVRTAASQVQGSVVSEAGGFAGVDDQPVDGYGKNRNGLEGKHHSSQASESSIVRPSEVLHNPSLAPYDYHKDVVYQSAQPTTSLENGMVEDEQPAPVTAAHLPDPSSCPLIPIHTTIASDQTEAESLKAISRRHIRIFWNWQKSAFYMEVLGRNGAFFDEEHMLQGESVRLYSGARIQISAVEFTFRLPDSIGEAQDEDEESDAASDVLDSSPQGAAARGSQATKLKLKLNTDSTSMQTVGPNGELKRRGPGRPPKNGIMSQREMKEREKAEKEAKTRALQGIPSPPATQRKLSKSQLAQREPVAEAPKTEKRKYNKRKREDGEEDEVLPSIEGQEDQQQVESSSAAPPPQPTAKRARTKSYSPEYKPFDQCSPEDLARPQHNYAVLLYMVLSETGEITLRQIYKQMQARWPFFRYGVGSDGWTSSVRHNLNQEVGKLFERGRKEGKGFTWLPKPNAMEEYQAQKNKRSNPPPTAKPRPAPQRPNYPPNQGQQLTWQNSGPMPQQNRQGDNFVHQGPWPAQQNNGTKPSTPASGPMANQSNGPRQMVAPPTYLQQMQNPSHLPPPQMLPQFFGKPAPRFIPVTFEGLAVISQFEQSMFKNLKQDDQTQSRWRAIFASAKARCLHGRTESTFPGGETSEEATIVKYIADFVTRYKNPAFTGFHSVSTASPDVTSVSTPTGTPGPSTSNPGSAQPSSASNQILQTTSKQAAVAAQPSTPLQATESSAIASHNTSLPVTIAKTEAHDSSGTTDELAKAAIKADESSANIEDPDTKTINGPIEAQPASQSDTQLAADKASIKISGDATVS